MSQLDEHKKEIDGDVYIVTMLPPRKARSVLVKISNTLGPSIERAAAIGGDDMDSAISKIAFKLIGSFLGSINENVLNEIIEEMSKVTIVDGKGKLDRIYDAQFIGRIDLEFEWLKFALEVQYKNFIDAVKSDLVSTMSKMEMAAVPQSPST